MPPWMKRRIEHARARCEKSITSNKQKAEGKEAEKRQDKGRSKPRTNPR